MTLSLGRPIPADDLAYVRLLVTTLLLVLLLPLVVVHVFANPRQAAERALGGGALAR